MKTTFIVTSAVNTRFGIYSPVQRLEMTLATIANLRERIPGCKIVLNEVSGSGIHEEYGNKLEEAVDVYIDFTTNSNVNWIYTNPQWYNNWDVVKNLTELSTFPESLLALKVRNELDDQDRIFKMSGRYLLNDKFDLSFYERDEVKDKVVIGKSVPSQFGAAVTGTDMQYMCRLLSWPRELGDGMEAWYRAARDYMVLRMTLGGYADIEHCLYQTIPKEHVHEVEEVGVYGNIAPNGMPIVN
jgi:hypothetical protein